MPSAIRLPQSPIKLFKPKHILSFPLRARRDGKMAAKLILGSEKLRGNCEDRKLNTKNTTTTPEGHGLMETRINFDENRCRPGRAAGSSAPTDRRFERLHAELLAHLQCLQAVNSSFMSASTSWPMPVSIDCISVVTKSFCSSMRDLAAPMNSCSVRSFAPTPSIDAL